MDDKDEKMLESDDVESEELSDKPELLDDSDESNVNSSVDPSELTELKSDDVSRDSSSTAPSSKVLDDASDTSDVVPSEESEPTSNDDTCSVASLDAISLFDSSGFEPSEEAEADAPPASCACTRAYEARLEYAGIESRTGENISTVWSSKAPIAIRRNRA